MKGRIVGNISRSITDNNAAVLGALTDDARLVEKIDVGDVRLVPANTGTTHPLPPSPVKKVCPRTCCALSEKGCTLKHTPDICGMSATVPVPSD